jgi:hypothetical protein
MPLYSDDFPFIQVGSLHIRPDHDDYGTVFTSDGSAVHYEYDTHTDQPWVTLAAGGYATTIRLTFGFSCNTMRAYFLGADGKRALKIFHVHNKFVTISESKLKLRARNLSVKRRMQQTRDRWAKKLMDYYRAHPTTAGREYALRTRLDMLNYKLSRM